MWFSIGKKLVTAEWFHIDQDSNQKNEAYLQTIKNRTYKPDLLLNLPKQFKSEDIDSLNWLFEHFKDNIYLTKIIPPRMPLNDFKLILSSCGLPLWGKFSEKYEEKTKEILPVISFCTWLFYRFQQPNSVIPIIKKIMEDHNPIQLIEVIETSISKFDNGLNDVIPLMQRLKVLSLRQLFFNIDLILEEIGQLCVKLTDEDIERFVKQIPTIFTQELTGNLDTDIKNYLELKYSRPIQFVDQATVINMTEFLNDALTINQGIDNMPEINIDLPLPNGNRVIFRKFDKRDPRQLCLGHDNEYDSCYTFDGMSAGALFDSIANPNAGNYEVIIVDSEGQLVKKLATSYAWLDRNGFCFDNIEDAINCENKSTDDQIDYYGLIAEAYKKAAKELYKTKDLVTIGKETSFAILKEIFEYPLSKDTTKYKCSRIVNKQINGDCRPYLQDSKIQICFEGHLEHPEYIDISNLLEDYRRLEKDKTKENILNILNNSRRPLLSDHDLAISLEYPNIFEKILSVGVSPGEETLLRSISLFGENQFSKENIYRIIKLIDKSSKIQINILKLIEKCKDVEILKLLKANNLISTEFPDRTVYDTILSTSLSIPSNCNLLKFCINFFEENGINDLNIKESSFAYCDLLADSILRANLEIIETLIEKYYKNTRFGSVSYYLIKRAMNIGDKAIYDKIMTLDLDLNQYQMEYMKGLEDLITKKTNDAVYIFKDIFNMFKNELHDQLNELNYLLEKAVDAGNLECAKFLYENGRRIDDGSMIKKAISSKNAKMVEWVLSIIDKRAIPHSSITDAIKHNMVIKYPSTFGIIKLLLKHDAQLEYDDPLSSLNTLNTAIKYTSDLRLINLLIKYGAKANEETIKCAIESQNKNILRSVLKIENPPNNYGLSLYLYYFEDGEFLQALFNAGCEPDTNTLNRAINTNSIDIVNQIISFHAKPSFSTYGSSIEIAIRKGNEEIVKRIYELADWSHFALENFASANPDMLNFINGLKANSFH